MLTIQTVVNALVKGNEKGHILQAVVAEYGLYERMTGLVSEDETFAEGVDEDGFLTRNLLAQDFAA